MNALLYALVVVIWGTTWIAISLQQQSGISPNVAVFWRFFISALVLFAFVVLCRKLQKLAVKDHLFCVLQACCIFGFNFVRYFFMELVERIFKYFFFGKNIFFDLMLFFNIKPNLPLPPVITILCFIAFIMYY
jgi:drug/metabolite transporter (DMT)-like permease